MPKRKDIPRVWVHIKSQNGYAKKKISLPCALSHTKPPAISKKWRRPKKKTCEKKKGKKGKATFTVLHVWVEGVIQKPKVKKKMSSSFFLLPIINSSSSSFRRKTNTRKTRKTNALSRCRLARRTTTTRRVSYRRSSEDASVRRL